MLAWAWPGLRYTAWCEAGDGKYELPTPSLQSGMIVIFQLCSVLLIEQKKENTLFSWECSEKKVDYCKSSHPMIPGSSVTQDKVQSSPPLWFVLATTHRSLSVPRGYFSPEPEFPSKKQGAHLGNQTDVCCLWLSSQLGTERPPLLMFCPEYHVGSACCISRSWPEEWVEHYSDHIMSGNVVPDLDAINSWQLPGTGLATWPRVYETVSTSQ